MEGGGVDLEEEEEDDDDEEEEDEAAGADEEEEDDDSSLKFSNFATSSLLSTIIAMSCNIRNKIRIEIAIEDIS